eukprot:gb/GECG01012684.1/.p1 GENE.gb/GECG01012684.1/~~gb/GECG01012684.1/.p1  ORF type:complete len:984 (+),score=112.22 gb/GECG01012684.1/:1-2952(+)
MGDLKNKNSSGPEHSGRSEQGTQNTTNDVAVHSNADAIASTNDTSAIAVPKSGVNTLTKSASMKVLDVKLPPADSDEEKEDVVRGSRIQLPQKAKSDGEVLKLHKEEEPTTVEVDNNRGRSMSEFHVDTLDENGEKVEPQELEKDVKALGIPNNKSCYENMRLKIRRLVKKTYKHVLVSSGLYPYARQVNYIIRQMIEHIFAVVPLTLYLSLFVVIFFQEGVEGGGPIAGGVISMIGGLLLFLEGIKISCMPLGEIVGRRLPEKYPLPVFFIVCFCLGVLTTFAEPAIAALTPLGALVKVDESPFLFHILNDWQQFLVLAIALGVGTATGIGAWRMLTNRPLLPQVYIVFIPTIVLAMYMMWGDEDLRPVIGLAWDSGAITTGPITASAILAVSSGIGETSVGSSSDASGSLGIVTLASLYPILYVEILAIIMSVTVERESILSSSSGSGADDGGSGGSFNAALMDTIQAALPLVGFLLLVLKVILRKSIPKVTWEDILEDKGDAAEQAKAQGEERSHLAKSSKEDHTGQTGTSFDAAVADLAGTDEALNEALRNHPLQGHQYSINSEEEGGSYLVPFMDRSDKRRFRTLWHVFPTMQRQDVHHYADDGSVITDVDGKSVAEFKNKNVPQQQYDKSESKAQSRHEDQNHSRHAPPPCSPTHSGEHSYESPTWNTLPPASAEAETIPRCGRSDGKVVEANGVFHEDIEVDEDDIVGHSFSFQLGDPDKSAPDKDASDTSKSSPADEDKEKGKIRCRRCRPINVRNWFRRNMFFLVGLCFIPIGLLFINVGIQFALTPLGDQVGSKMPALFMSGEGVEENKIMPRGIGLVITGIYIFLLGFFATKAEPALVVLGMTVEELTGGEFGRRKLQNSVAFGVGVGVTLGLFQIIFDWPILYILLVGYAIALSLSLDAGHSVRCASWDSGGVTTGPVTVPLILAMGISFGNAVDAESGFGILASASISPIVAVLVMNSGSKLFKAYRENS